jgi:OOP family OmpA-OmpF porin
MGRKLAASLIAALALGSLAGCTIHAQTGSPQEPAPAPAPTTEQTTTPTETTTTETTTMPSKGTSTVKQEGAKLKMPGDIKFEFAKATLLPESEPVLEQLKLFLEEKTQITLVRIEGHTDNVGQAAANLKLSGERALAVREWLVNHGIADKRLIAIGFGDLKPIADNASDEGRAQNRRTEFIVVEVGSKPWLGADATGGGTVFGTNPR